MTSDVLVLNRRFYAIQTTSLRRALTLLYLDHAQVVDADYHTYDFEDWRAFSAAVSAHPAGTIATPRFRLATPEVIVLKVFDRRPETRIPFTRRNIYEHYGYRCCYCGRKFPSDELNLDHVVPRSRHGATDWDNIVTSCIPCNLKKGNRLPSEAGMRLRLEPSRPRWRGPASLVFRAPFSLPRSWQRFLDSVYWNCELEEG